MRIDRDRLRLYALAITAGAIAEVGLVLALQGTSNQFLPALFLVEAIVLGFVFGALPGMVAAVLPWIVLYPVALMVDDVTTPIALLSAVIFVVILQAFLAGMAGAMRARYGRRSEPPPVA